MSLERATINCTMTHSVVESALFSSSWALRVKWEWLWAPHTVLILDGVEDMVHGDFEWSEVSFLFVGLGRVPGGYLLIASEARF